MAYYVVYYVLFWTEICSRYLQKLHLTYKFSFGNWPLSVFSVANSTWKIDRRFKQSHECESRSAGILNPVLRLSFSDITEVKQNLRSIVTDFNFGAVKLPLNLPNIALFLILSLSRKPVRESPLLSKSLLKLTEPFWISHVSCVFLASDIYFRKFLAE